MIPGQPLIQRGNTSTSWAIASSIPFTITCILIWASHAASSPMRSCSGATCVPFVPEPKAPGEKDKEKEEVSAKKFHEGAGENGEAAKEESDKEETTPRTAPIVIDLDGITERALPFPVGESRYSQIRGIKGKALFLSSPVEGAVSDLVNSHDWRGSLDYYDFENHKCERVADGINDFDLSRDSKTLIYRSYHRLRVFKAGDKAPKADNGDRPGRESGWINLGRVKVSVQPAAEWKQMFAEAWRLQREQFWTE